MSAADQVTDREQALLEEAVDWLMQLRLEPVDHDVMLEWERWLQTSDHHAAAWSKICRTWQVLGMPHAGAGQAAAPSCEPAAAEGSRGGVVSRRAIAGRRIWRGFAGAALVAGLLAWLVAPMVLVRLQADFRTGHGESRVVALADGSTVTMGADSALAVEFAGMERGVRLLAGEAFFDIAPDASRPFHVAAQDAEIRVLGTAFNVQETETGTRVELAHGSIALWPLAEHARQISLRPGDAVVVARSDGSIQTSRIDPLDIGLWREGRLAVTDQTVASVVSVIQRYHPAWIMVPEPRVAALRVSGLFDLSDPDLALAALAQPFGLTVRRVSPYLRVISEF